MIKKYKTILNLILKLSSLFMLKQLFYLYLLQLDCLMQTLWFELYFLILLCNLLNIEFVNTIKNEKKLLNKVNSILLLVNLIISTRLFSTFKNKKTTFNITYIIAFIFDVKNDK